MAANKTGRYVQSVDIEDGTITVTYGLDANSRIEDDTLAIRPFVNENGDVVWQCGNATQPDDSYENSGGADGGGTDSAEGTTSLLDKYMPASCRTGFGS